MSYKASYMMKRISKKFWLPVALAIMAIITSLSIILLHEVIKINNSPEAQISRFNETLNNRYENNQELLIDIANQFPSPEFQKVHTLSKKLPQNISLFITKGNYLVYWSDNSIAIEFPTQGKRIIKSPNGIFQQNELTKGNYRYILLDLIKHSYPYNNHYLISSYNPVYDLPASFEIADNAAAYSVDDKNNKTLLYIEADQAQIYTGEQEFILYVLSLLTYLFFIFSIYYLTVNMGLSKLTTVMIVYLSAIGLRLLTFTLKIPHLFNEFQLFSPLNYASSPWLPSLGDLLTNVIIFTVLHFIVFQVYRRHVIQIPRRSLALLYSIICIGITIFFYFLSLYLNDTITINSSFELNLAKILDFTPYSIIGYFILAMIMLSFFFTSFIAVRTGIKLVGARFFSLLFIGLNVIVWLIFTNYNLYTPEWQEMLFFTAFIVILILIFTNKLPFPHIATSSIIILILTVISSFCLYHNREAKELEERKLMALRLSSDQDKVAEFLYADVEKAIVNDQELYTLFMGAWYNQADEGKCIEYIQNKYFNGFWSKYNAQITLCYPDKQLALKPSNVIIDCSDYFNTIIATITERTSDSTLYYVKESYGTNSYIARIPIKSKEFNNSPAHIVIELTQKYVPKGLGYPELLLDQSFVSFYDLSVYSYAIYSKGELIKNVGDYYYSISEKPFLPFKKEYNFFDKNGYSHLYHKINNETSIIISKKTQTLLDQLAPFTYQLIFHIILLFLLKTVYNIRSKKNRFPVLKTQLQIMLVALVLFSSIIIGMTTIHNIKTLNNKKNQDMLSEKAHSVLIEMEHKLDSYSDIDGADRAYLQELLTKFSLVFFSDINLYTTDGDLLASSRQEIFSEGLRSSRMTAEAFNELAVNQRTFYVTNEQIGKYQYLSAYIPFRNNNNKLIAYINLPYFAREHELRQEISSFLVTFVNIYIILTAIAVVISLIVGNYVTRPLQLIRDQFSNVKLDKRNEKITYNRDDELGSLINEYNLMLDKLAESVNKLAQSERESAWKEMAQQIAHEIKNPLTPMKLSIQHLYKSWQDNAPDWEARLSKTTTSLIQQIDSLAAIASAFSDFAKFPVPSNESVELVKLIKDTVALFVTQTDFQIDFNHPEKPCYVLADPKQLSRVMVNLLNNAIQAIPVGIMGIITITLKQVGSDYHVLINDNGIGIPEEQKIKIFSPNFTTKSGGTGLGLAMVKNIIDSTKGSISFTSDDQGTTFEIRLPALIIDN